MKKLLLASLCILLTTSMFSATYTSNGDGNWLNPTTWSPMGVPIDGDIVTIYHNVILDTDFLLSSGSIYIADGASLIESVVGRAFALSGGSIENNGTLTISVFATNSGSFMNNGTFSVTALYNSLILHNYGNIVEIDSMLNEGNLINYSDSYLDASKFLNDGIFSNAGVYEGMDFYNNSIFYNSLIVNLTYFTNADTTGNTGNISFWDCTNLGGFNNMGEMYGENSFSNLGFFHNGVELILDYDFFNGDTADGDAYFYNAGFVMVGNNFLNIDVIDGSVDGQFCVDYLSGNEGLMTGYFEFCDNSSIGSIDYNSGTIEADVTYCSAPCGTSVSTSQIDLVEVYPVPASDYFNVSISSNNAEFTVYDIAGKIIIKEYLLSGENTFSCEKMAPGTYLYEITEMGSVYNGKIMVNR